MRPAAPVAHVGPVYRLGRRRRRTFARRVLTPLGRWGR